MSETTRRKVTLDAAVCTRIRDRAYKLYCERGFRDGLAMQDWLQAEAEVLHELRLGPLASTSVSLEAQTRWNHATN